MRHTSILCSGYTLTLQTLNIPLSWQLFITTFIYGNEPSLNHRWKGVSFLHALLKAVVFLFASLGICCLLLAVGREKCMQRRGNTLSFGPSCRVLGHWLECNWQKQSNFWFLDLLFMFCFELNLVNTWYK